MLEQTDRGPGAQRRDGVHGERLPARQPHLAQGRPAAASKFEGASRQPRAPPHRHRVQGGPRHVPVRRPQRERHGPGIGRTSPRRLV
jgi:hypothetical protein